MSTTTTTVPEILSELTKPKNVLERLSGLKVIGDYIIRYDPSDVIITYRVGAAADEAAPVVVAADDATGPPNPPTPPSGPPTPPTTPPTPPTPPTGPPAPLAAATAGDAFTPAVLGIRGVQALPYIIKFFEEQQNAFCGRHALNNLFHNRYFSDERNPPLVLQKNTPGLNAKLEGLFTGLAPPKGSASPSPENEIPLQTICGLVNSFVDVGGCIASGWYDITVLQAALKIIGHSSESLTMFPDGKTITIPPNESNLVNVLGFVINYGAYHWVALRKIPETLPNAGQYQYIDSLSRDKTKIYEKYTDYLTDMAHRDGNKIVNMLMVYNFSGYKNPIERLVSLTGVESDKAELSAKLLGEGKLALKKVFYEKIRLKLENSENVENSEKFTSVIEKIIDNISSIPDIRTILDFFNMDNVSDILNTDEVIRLSLKENKGSVEAQVTTFVTFAKAAVEAAEAAGGAAEGGAGGATGGGKRIIRKRSTRKLRKRHSTSKTR